MATRTLHRSILLATFTLLAASAGCGGEDASSQPDPGATSSEGGSGGAAPQGGGAGASQAGGAGAGGAVGPGGASGAGSSGAPGGAGSGGSAGSAGGSAGSAGDAGSAGTAGSAGSGSGGDAGSAGSEAGGSGGSAGSAGSAGDGSGGTQGGAGAPPGPTTYTNPVLDENGDPACVRIGEHYYLYLPDQVAGGGKVRGFRSTDLVHWNSLGAVYDNVDETSGTQKSTGLWAPEVLAYQGKFYLYYARLMSNPLDDAVGDKDIVVVESDKPDDFHGGKRTVLLDNAYAFIDPSPFVDPQNGNMYLYFKYRGPKGTGSEIQVRPMKSPTAFDGPAKQIVDSEKVPNADHTVEQPMMWRDNNVFFLLYSKGDGGGTNYQIAYATSTSALGPFTQQGDLFRSDSDLSGSLAQKVISPGASSVVLDGNKKPWIVYRQKKTKADTFADRFVAIDPLTFKPASETIEGKPTRGEKHTGPVPLSP